ncbi:hypothetical protein DMENIID0001_149780 [Sergentomyia squamirostris]
MVQPCKWWERGTGCYHNAPWYVTNEQLQSGLIVPTIQEEIFKFCRAYRERLLVHSNDLAGGLVISEGNQKRLSRTRPDLFVAL